MDLSEFDMDQIFTPDYAAINQCPRLPCRLNHLDWIQANSVRAHNSASAQFLVICRVEGPCIHTPPSTSYPAELGALVSIAVRVTRQLP